MPLKDTAYPAPEDHLDTYEDQYGVLPSTIRRIKIQRISFKSLYSIRRMHIPNTPYPRSVKILEGIKISNVVPTPSQHRYGVLTKSIRRIDLPDRQLYKLIH